MTDGTSSVIDISGVVNERQRRRWSRKSLDAFVGMRTLFSSGWAFFLPYAFLYLLGLASGWTNGTVRSQFWACHIALLAMLVAFTLATLKTRYAAVDGLVRDPGCWFWVLLCLGFILPGAYLEFPADPWEHFRRLHAWDAGATLRHSPWVHKFAYFWGWTLFSLLAPIHQRMAAHVYSAFWQVLLAYQFYRLGLRLSGSKTWAKIHVIGVIALFGNDVFGFFRYYALSSTPLAYIAYLAAAIAVLDLCDARVPAWRTVATVLVATCLITMNHIQELILTAVFASTVVLAALWSRLSRRGRFVLGSIATAGYMISLLVARRAMADPAAFGLTPGRFYRPYISELGVFRLWDTHLSYFHTIGLHGILAVVMGLIFWRSQRLIAALTLAPVAILLFPPFVIPFAQFAPRLDFTYRVLFLLPTSLMLVTAFQASARFFPGPPAQTERRLQTAAVALVLILGFYESPPVFGKLRFQYHRPSDLLQARYVDAAAQWFWEHPRQPQCVPTSDAVTETVLVDYFGAPIHVDRLTGAPYPGYSWSANNVLELLDQAAAYSRCGFLVLETSPDLWKHERSHYGPLSGHWGAHRADPFVRTPPGFRERVPSLLGWGWTKTFVPPFYWYYEPPTGGPVRR